MFSSTDWQRGLMRPVSQSRSISIKMGTGGGGVIPHPASNVPALLSTTTSVFRPPGPSKHPCKHSFTFRLCFSEFRLFPWKFSQSNYQKNQHVISKPFGWSPSPPPGNSSVSGKQLQVFLFGWMWSASLHTHGTIKIMCSSVGEDEGWGSMGSNCSFYFLS